MHGLTCIIQVILSVWVTSLRHGILAHTCGWAEHQPCPKLTDYSGDACIEPGNTSMITDDPSSGVDLHRLDHNGHQKVKSFKIPITKKMRVRKVCFANKYGELVGGSDHGVIYVFDRRDGTTVDELKIDASEWAQTVTVSPVSQVLSSANMASRPQNATAFRPFSRLNLGSRRRPNPTKFTSGGVRRATGMAFPGFPAA